MSIANCEQIDSINNDDKYASFVFSRFFQLRVYTLSSVASDKYDNKQ